MSSEAQPITGYSFDALFTAAMQLTHMCHDAKERGDREALADYRARRNLIRAELERRCVVPGIERRPLPLHRTEAGYPRCSTCDGGGCLDCTDPA